MQLEQILENFKSQASSLKEKYEASQKQTRDYEKELEAKKFVVIAIEGLESTKKEKYPGKIRPAFYFVSEITEKFISSSEAPSLMKNCSNCGEPKPVIMRYEQTHDSPDGDIWESEAYTLCENHGLTSIKLIQQNY